MKMIEIDKCAGGIDVTATAEYDEEKRLKVLGAGQLP
jgi:hypothetical protein